MFCPKCGKADQKENTYCRHCGEFLTDSSKKFSSIYNFFGINTPEKQVNAGIIIDIAGAVFSSLLFVFLIGYIESQLDKTPPVTVPTIIYVVSGFMIFISIWQFLGFVLNLKLKSKFSGRNELQSITNSAARENAVTSAETLELLPPADFENMIPPNATENTTRKLKVENR